MSYVALGWGSSDLISARRLRWMEGQYDEAMEDLAVHNHDSSYYLESQADTKYFHLDGGIIKPIQSFNADMLQGRHSADLIGVVIPAGAILAWSGTDADIPLGWRICNGVGGTPDLRDRFVVGAGGVYSTGQTGGVIEITPSAGTVAIAGHAITLLQMPRHRHQYYDRYSGAAAGTRLYYEEYFVTAQSTTTVNSGAAGKTPSDPHGHAGSSVSITSGAVDNRPPYYALFFIQKVA